MKLVPYPSAQNVFLPDSVKDSLGAIEEMVNSARHAMSDGGEILVSTYYRKVDTEYCHRHGNARIGEFWRIERE